MSDKKPYASGTRHQIQIRPDAIRMGGGGYEQIIETEDPFAEVRKKFVRITWTGKDGYEYVEEMYIETTDLFSMFE
ncbi:MAG TPA: hypothetical protein DDY49_15165 [Paenibacillaceae bacterium]|nr:hypothetical protein [Paenibacillaceae bacterium]